MRADDFLAAAEALPHGTVVDLAPAGGLLVVAPHPDDESLGCGATIAAARAAGRDVRIVIVSDGIGSHPNSKVYGPARLRDLRESETLAAAAELGVAPGKVAFLRLPDRYVPVAGAAADASVAAIAAAAAACAAGAVLVTWAHDPHCDHGAAHALVMRAGPDLGGAAVFAYPVWGWTLPDSQEVGAAPAGWRIPVGPHRDAKMRAIAAHRSQTTDVVDDDPEGFRLPPEMIERFLTRDEIFLAPNPETRT